MSAPISSGILEDFLENIEHLPAEIQSKFTLLAEKEQAYDELKKSLHKRRHALLKSQVKAASFDSTSKLTDASSDSPVKEFEASKMEALKKIEEEFKRASTLLDEKMALGQEIKSIVEHYLVALDYELGKIDMATENGQSSTSLSLRSFPQSS